MGAIWPGVLVVVYLAATELLLVAGRSRDWRAIGVHAVLLAGVAACTWARGVPPWLRSFAPLLVVAALYTELPALIRAAGHAGTYDSLVVAWEARVFGGQPARTWAAAAPSAALSELLHAAYLSYYAVIFSVPVALYASQRHRELSEALLIVLLTFVICFVFYIAFPVAGPRYLWPSTVREGGPLRTLTLWLLESRSSKGTAFPSSHVAVAVTQSLLALRYFGRAGLLVVVLTVGLAAGAVYGGFHYAIDVLAGAALGVAVTLSAGFRLASRERQANATAPT